VTHRTKWKNALIEDGFIKIDLAPHEKDGEFHFAVRIKNGKIQYQVIYEREKK
jgi:hypothetical protein